jgi:exonuclease SbcC
VSPRRLAELAAAVTAYRAAQERVTTGLLDPELAQLPEDAQVDVPAAALAERNAREVSVGAAAAATTAERRVTEADRAAREVVAAAEDFVRAAAEAEPVTRLAGLASGTGSDNTRSLSLAAYVLARRFEDVVAAANDRLLDMSDGRYELARSDRKEDVGSRRAGLSMRVLDHVTETERDPRSLSGGETFYVSLCLALGMADVVTAEAGGIELGTLFVDEGFGSLDPHVLENVLAALGRLRAGGRVVGVVSHVEALKQAVADRVEVRPSGHGPSTLTVLAG